jgi:hypothetical protein
MHVIKNNKANTYPKRQTGLLKEDPCNLDIIYLKVKYISVYCILKFLNGRTH